MNDFDPLHYLAHLKGVCDFPARHERRLAPICGAKIKQGSVVVVINLAELVVLEIIWVYTGKQLLEVYLQICVHKVVLVTTNALLQFNSNCGDSKGQCTHLIEHLCWLAFLIVNKDLVLLKAVSLCQCRLDYNLNRGIVQFFRSHQKSVRHCQGILKYLMQSFCFFYLARVTESA